MPPVATVQKWPSDYVIRESLRQLDMSPVNCARDMLDWLLKVWPGCAIMVVWNADRLPARHREVVKRWGEESLWPGNYDPSGLDYPPAGGGAGRSGSAGSGSWWQYRGANPPRRSARTFGRWRLTQMENPLRNPTSWAGYGSAQHTTTGASPGRTSDTTSGAMWECS